MRKIRKTLHVKARKNSAGGKFQSEMETVGVLGVADIAELRGGPLKRVEI